MNLSDRAMQVALTGEVPEDDPHVIADMMAEIDRLRGLLDAKVTPGYELLADTIVKRDAEIDRLRSILKELADSVDKKASAYAKPERYYSPRMEDAIRAARAALKT